MPDITVVIASRGRQRDLRSCLDSLVRQTLPTSVFEVVVALDERDRASRSVVDEYSQLLACRSMAHRWAETAWALDAAAADARGRYLLFIGDAGIADPGVVAAHLAAQERTPSVGVGMVHQIHNGTTSALGRWLEADATSRYGPGSGREPALEDADARNLSVPPAAFLAAGGFAAGPPGGNAADLAARLRRRRVPFVHVPAMVEHPGGSRRSILRNEQARGRASVDIYSRQPDALDGLRLGHFFRTSLRGLLLRRLLLRLRIPVSLLAVLARPARTGSWSGELARFLSDYAYWAGARSVSSRAMWDGLTSGTLVLMYHAIARPGEHPSRYVVSPRAFLRQMRQLRDSGRPTISLDGYVRLRERDELPSPGTIIVTFDDGYADNEVAHRILALTGTPATIFLATSFIGDRNRWDAEGVLARRPLMDWPTVRRLAAEGMTFGSHSRRHQRLDHLDDKSLRDEVLGSVRDLELQMGSVPSLFAYPYGDQNARVRSVVRDAGFALACAGVNGVNSAAEDIHALRRTEVQGTYGRLRWTVLLRLGVADPIRRIRTGR